MTDKYVIDRSQPRNGQYSLYWGHDGLKYYGVNKAGQRVSSVDTQTGQINDFVRLAEDQFPMIKQVVARLTDVKEYDHAPRNGRDEDGNPTTFEVGTTGVDPVTGLRWFLTAGAKRALKSNMFFRPRAIPRGQSDDILNYSSESEPSAAEMAVLDSLPA